MNIFVAIALVAVGVAIGYGFRAWIGREMLSVKAELTEIKAKIKSRV